MSEDSNDKPLDPPQQRKQALLGELESIKDLLDDSTSPALTDELLDIPLLDDVVPELSQHGERHSPLLDLANIFDDDEARDSTPPPSSGPAAVSLDASFPEFSRDKLPASTEPQLTESDDSNWLSALDDDFDSVAPAAQPEPPEQKPNNHSNEEQPGLLPLASPPNTENAAPPEPSDFDIELLIQELVDEFIPTIESRLRERLSSLDTDTIRQLANRHLE